jgi:hypothetical protein
MGASCTTDRSRWIWLVREKTARAAVVVGIAVATLAPAAAATSRTCNAPLTPRLIEAGRFYVSMKSSSSH